MDGPPTANEIKSQLGVLLTPAIGTTATKKTKIIDTMQYPFGRGSDPTALRSELDEVVLFEGEGVKSRINALMITEAGFTQSPPPQDSTLLLTEARGKKTVTRRFRLTFFYEVSDDPEDDSEGQASAIIEVARVALNQNPKLGFAIVVNYIAGPAQFVEGHDGLQIPLGSFLPEAYGTAMAHTGYAHLDVRVFEPQERV
jgi:hypothetical protein